LKLSRLVILLEREVPRFSKPKQELEQYRTPPEIALHMSVIATRLGCRYVMDLGTGTGMIAYASALLGVYVVGVDLDSDALMDAKNSKLYNETIVDFVQADALYLPLREIKRDDGFCILENPPFGLHRRRADTLFLDAASKSGAVYIVSIHHGGVDKTLKYLGKFMHERGYEIRYVEAFKFPIPAMYKGHKRRVYYVPALLIVFEKRGQEG